MTAMETKPASSPAIEPCPFCGGTDIVVDDDLLTYLFCNDCGANLPGKEGLTAAVSAWNTRAS